MEEGGLRGHPRAVRGRARGVDRAAVGLSARGAASGELAAWRSGDLVPLPGTAGCQDARLPRRRGSAAAGWARVRRTRGSRGSARRVPGVVASAPLGARAWPPPWPPPRASPRTQPVVRGTAHRRSGRGGGVRAAASGVRVRQNARQPGARLSAGHPLSSESPVAMACDGAAGAIPPEALCPYDARRACASDSVVGSHRLDEWPQMRCRASSNL